VASAPEWVAAVGQASTGLAAVVAGWAAIQGLGAWRREAVGRRKAELAEEVLAQFYRAKDVLAWARFPDTAREGGPAAGAEGQDSTRLRAAASAPVEKLTQASQLFSDLQASRYRFMAHFGEEAARPFAELGAIHNEIITAANRLVRTFDEAAAPPDPARRDAWEDTIGWRDENGDPLACRLARAVSAIERTCRPLIDEGEGLRPRALFKWR
jgi:hypothetical protein